MFHSIAIKNGFVFFISVSNTKADTIGPLLVVRLSLLYPLFYCRRISFVFGVFKNHRFVNYSSLNRYKLAKNRWYKDGVHNQVAEGNHRLVKTAFSAYEYIRPKFNQLYLNEFSFLKNINVLELDSLESKRLGENFKNSSDEL
ncbi:transposase [Leptospira noguchii]|uniref:ISXO2-like transposase domain protein n=1 Tax=Leptospira noguchii serovar Autumnalis str. ZUN142 TaxID=1085540 RepID=M6U3M6_9LEPT|nr:hypothetical protein [Leptospira noguchii]EMO39642.1 hypothetical protein LEP1GSC186_1040 [Leptospira noguchii serovar Autumnalis str. ZUN142]TQE83490.1 transposase [Leptospira noguchii]